MDAGIEYRVIGVGCPDEIPDWVDVRVHTDCVSMQADIEQVEREYPADVSVLLQLTQPLRERGLLMRTLEQFRRNGRTIVSATRMRDQRWRVLNCNGVWYEKDTVFTDQENGWVLLHDGVIYAWERGKAHEIFERTRPHDIVISSEVLPLIDVDYQEELIALELR